MKTVVSLFFIVVGTVLAYLAIFNPKSTMNKMFERREILPFTTGARNLVHSAKTYRIYFCIMGLIGVVLGFTGLLIIH